MDNIFQLLENSCFGHTKILFEKRILCLIELHKDIHFEQLYGNQKRVLQSQNY
jgi:hypothetical protein